MPQTAELNYGVVYNYELSIGTAYSTTWTYSPLSVGLENLQEAANEVVQSMQFLSGKGTSNHFVTGAAPQVTIQCRRVYGDAAQDYIFETIKGTYGVSRESSLQIVSKDANGTTVSTKTVPVTVTDIVEINGATTDISQGSFVLRFNGAQPTETV